ncbi:Isochorismatase hydrolase protein [Neofusicoccum parvum]|uniref:Isochorismatase-like domain-containing protein n=3 Tax=Neofusicoccum TaxID=407951 RepID=A0ABR3TE87_9PEZI|nr:putative isochorismatase hydrolase protein [Neofusicoccum parvum UCRNP2]GME28592.1 Isochorismatase hydrolase protein [Neofusicoccum parvum]GME58711.1 Isochorismatase hydrolase protein [Neofusicoccum parvum]
MAKSFRELAGIPPTVATPANSILVIIDAQNEYASGALAVAGLSTSRPAIAALLERYRAAAGHVAHVVHAVPDGTPVFTPGTPLADEFAELAPRTTAESGGKEVVISKKFPGAFAETGLGDFVKSTGKTKVVLVGYMAHVCVSTTAREADQRGLEVVVVEDAVGDRDIPGGTGAEVTKWVLAELGDAFGTIVKSADIK